MNAVAARSAVDWRDLLERGPRKRDEGDGYAVMEPGRDRTKSPGFDALLTLKKLPAKAALCRNFAAASAITYFSNAGIIAFAK